MKLKACRLLLSLAALVLFTTSTFAQLVNYELVTVGDPGNPNDTVESFGGQFYGAVPYAYQIGKYEVTISQYTAFLNAVAKTDTYSLYNTSMATDLNIAGISRSGSDGSYEYSVIGPSGITPPGADSPGNRPITYVSWWDSARFANWMSNGQPAGAQGPTTTENGAYNLANWLSGTAPSVNASNPNTGTEPLYRIPTENEWYKAAYYKGGGTNAGYWPYATQGTSMINQIDNQANRANWYQFKFTVTQSSGTSSSQNYLTNVGAFTGSPSAFGTFDQSGNVLEWNDLSGVADSARGYRGGNWGSGGEFVLSSSIRDASPPTVEGYLTGFRLASPIPEPSTWVMGSLGITCAGWHAFRRRKRA